VCVTLPPPRDATATTAPLILDIHLNTHAQHRGEVNEYALSNILLQGVGVAQTI
jgi:hypothetical protein